MLLFLWIAFCTIIHSITAAPNVEIRFKIHLKESFKPQDVAATGHSRSLLPYSLRLLDSGTRGFDLKAVMMQDGFLKSHGHDRKRFSENTVLRIPTSRSLGDHVMVCIQIYGLPETIQDYFVIDLTKVLAPEREAIFSHISSDKFNFKAISRLISVEKKLADSSCSCSGYSCGCCEFFHVPKVYLNETGCANITYLSKDKGFSLTFSLNGRVWFNETMSLRNPPPVCFSVPYLKEYASLCIKFHDLELKDEQFDGCLEFETELYHVKVYEHELGCFRIPV